MFSIRDLKIRAKATLGKAYWKCVLAALVLMLATGGGSGGSSGSSYSNILRKDSGSSQSSIDFSTEGIGAELGEDLEDDLEEAKDDVREAIGLFAAPVIGMVAVFILIILVVSICISVFLFAPLEVGCRKFFIRGSRGTFELGDMGAAFNSSYMNVVKTMFLKDLYTFLWSLLLIVPGIIKSYEYRMIPYILAENPDISTQEAFDRSKTMMYGDKLNAFVLDLSFFGWILLTLCTCGLLGIFYVNPYYYNTDAELYAALLPKIGVNPGNYNNGGSFGVYGEAQDQPFSQPYQKSYAPAPGQTYQQPVNPAPGQTYQQPVNPNFTPIDAPSYPASTDTPEGQGSPADPDSPSGYGAGIADEPSHGADNGSPFHVPYGQSGSSGGSNIDDPDR